MERECYKRADYCFVSARMYDEKCELCGSDFGGAVKANIRGTEEGKFLCAACWWESRVAQAMPLCPCTGNVRMIQVTHLQRALRRAGLGIVPATIPLMAGCWGVRPVCRKNCMSRHARRDPSTLFRMLHCRCEETPASSWPAIGGPS